MDNDDVKSMSATEVLLIIGCALLFMNIVFGLVLITGVILQAEMSQAKLVTIQKEENESIGYVQQQMVLSS